MKPATLKALKASIVKWERIVTGEGFDKGRDNCPLCKKFIAKDCEGCPVAKRTGRTNCNDTPYRDFVDAADREPAARGDAVYHATSPAARRVALKELRFLESLLP